MVDFIKTLTVPVNTSDFIFWDSLYNSCIHEYKLIIGNSPSAVAEAIDLINVSSNKPTDAGLKIEAKKFSELFDSDETFEGLSAFIEKRPPKY